MPPSKVVSIGMVGSAYDPADGGGDHGYEGTKLAYLTMHAGLFEPAAPRSAGRPRSCSDPRGVARAEA